jgi:hypothetical protein
MIKLIEIKKIKDFNPMVHHEKVRYELCEIWINPDSILQVREAPSMKRNLKEGYLPSRMDSRQEFSSIHFGSGNNVSMAIVVGTPDVVAEKIHNVTTKKVLKG